MLRTIWVVVAAVLVTIPLATAVILLAFFSLSARPIDRKNRRTAVKSFDMAAERIRRGNTIVIFPEEGRSRNREMRPFQRGAFLLAIKSQVPVVPIAIDGTYDVYRVGAKR